MRCTRYFTERDFPSGGRLWVWWKWYLANLSAVQRNVVECILERRNTDLGQSGLYTRDACSGPLQEACFTEAHPDLSWLLVCLDGAPERVRRYENSMFYDDPNTPDRNAAVWGYERSFRSLVEGCVKASSARMPVAMIENVFFDGVVLAYESTHEAVLIAHECALACKAFNQENSLSWEWEAHVRASVAPTLREMFHGLIETPRDHICVMLNGGMARQCLLP